MKYLFNILLIIPIITDFNFHAKEKEYITNENTDKRFIELINQYRAYYHKSPFKWNATAYKMAIHHTEYQYQMKTVCHNEIENVSLKKVKSTKSIILISLQDRADYFSLKNKFFGECVIGGNLSTELTPTMPFSMFVKEFFKKNAIDCNPIDRLLYIFLWQWENSPPHKEVMLGDFNSGAISIKYVIPEVFEKSIFHEGRPVQQDYYYATLNTVLN